MPSRCWRWLKQDRETKATSAVAFRLPDAADRAPKCFILRCEGRHIGWPRFELVRLLRTRKVEASMHGRFDRPSEIRNRSDRSWSIAVIALPIICLLYTSPSPRDRQKSRM